MKRSATATWEGKGRDASGIVSTESALIQFLPYSFPSRFNESNGTSPEELLAAACASDFSMKLGFVLNERGFATVSVETKVSVHIENGRITDIGLLVKGGFAGIDEQELLRSSREALEFGLVCRILKLPVEIEIQRK